MLKINNVLSLFDGASCAQMSLNHAGIPFKKYFASEINEDSIAIALKNYPNTKKTNTKWPTSNQFYKKTKIAS